MTASEAFESRLPEDEHICADCGPECYYLGADRYYCACDPCEACEDERREDERRAARSAPVFDSADVPF